MRLDEKNCQFLWCTKVFQGINATKSISHILSNKGMHIKICYIPKDRSHITIYQELKHSKKFCKVVLHEYSENIKASISSLHNKSSAAI